MRQLWSLLGIEANRNRTGSELGDDLFVVWQRYNPYPKNKSFESIPEFVFVRSQRNPDGSDAAAGQLFSNVSPIVSELQEVLFPFPGAVTPVEDSGLTVTPLITTGMAGVLPASRYSDAGVLPANEQVSARRGMAEISKLRGQADGRYTVSVHITGKAKSAQPADQDLNVVYVADVDVLSDALVLVRQLPESDLNQFRFQNTSFILNAIDSLAADDRYISIRTRQRQNKTLRRIEEEIEKANEQVTLEQQETVKETADALKRARSEMEKTLKEYEDFFRQVKERQDQGEEIDPQIVLIKSQARQRDAAILEEKYKATKERLEQEEREKIQQIKRDAEVEIQRIQTDFKVWAAILPPVLPMLVGLVVFAKRRLREREGMSRARLRIGADKK
jgi:ABC-2 type transport system permease protein